MSSETNTAELAAAANALWDYLAAFAWDRQLALGRGVVLVDSHDLKHAADVADENESPELPLSYVPAEFVPPADDYRAIILQYDPEREVLLLVGGEKTEDVLLRLQSDDDRRASPPECHAHLSGESQ